MAKVKIRRNERYNGFATVLEWSGRTVKESRECTIVHYKTWKRRFPEACKNWRPHQTRTFEITVKRVEE